MYARPTLVKLWWSNSFFFFFHILKQIQISYIHLSWRMELFFYQFLMEWFFNSDLR